MTIAERLKQWRAKKDLDQKEACAIFGVPYSTYQKYELDKTQPGAEAIKGFIHAGINANWLLTGKGPMLLADIQGENSNNVDERRLLLAIKTVEEILHGSDLDMARPGKRGELITMAYIIHEEYSDQTPEHAKKVIERLINSSAWIKHQDSDYKFKTILKICEQQNLDDWRKEFMKNNFGKESMTELSDSELQTLYQAVMRKRK